MVWFNSDTLRLIRYNLIWNKADTRILELNSEKINSDTIFFDSDFGKVELIDKNSFTKLIVHNEYDYRITEEYKISKCDKAE